MTIQELTKSEDDVWEYGAFGNGRYIFMIRSKNLIGLVVGDGLGNRVKVVSELRELYNKN